MELHSVLGFLLGISLKNNAIQITSTREITRRYSMYLRKLLELIVIMLEHGMNLKAM